MNNLNFPNAKSSEYLLQLFNFKSKDKQLIFEDHYGLFLLNERIYLQKALLNDLNALPQGNPFAPSIIKDDLIKLYDKKFVQGTGRPIYTNILKSTNLCPSCLTREPNQVDHYLPKADYPIYSVSTYNLVPICHKCNGCKSNKDNSALLFIHPYFDQLPTSQWLHLKLIITGTNIGFNYYIELNPTLKDFEKIEKKIESHIKNLNLLEIYNSKISSHHASIFEALLNPYKLTKDSFGKTVILSIIDGYIMGLSNDSENYFLKIFYESLKSDEYIENYLDTFI